MVAEGQGRRPAPNAPRKILAFLDVIDAFSKEEF